VLSAQYIKNIPVSLIKKIRRICSSFIDYLYFARLFYFKLTERGYNSKQIKGIIREIGKIENRLPYKNKELSPTDNKIKLFIEYDKASYFLNHLIHDSANKLA